MPFPKRASVSFHRQVIVPVRDEVIHTARGPTALGLGEMDLMTRYPFNTATIEHFVPENVKAYSV